MDEGQGPAGSTDPGRRRTITFCMVLLGPALLAYAGLGQVIVKGGLAVFAVQVIVGSLLIRAPPME